MKPEDEWARAYATQAKADLAARETLCKDAALPHCQQLHFVQMACEKLAKAHAYGLKKVPKSIHRSHNFIRKFIPLVAKQEFVYCYGRKIKNRTFSLQRIRHLAKEIEFLCPAVDDNGTRPDNCEYPWRDAAGRIHTPAAHVFSSLNFLSEQTGRQFLKLLALAADRLSGTP